MATTEKLSLVYNFEDDNYTWMQASEPTAEGLIPIVCMQYGFNPGWVVRWVDLIDTTDTWDDPDHVPDLTVDGTLWRDFYFHGTEENMYWLTRSSLLRADQQIQLENNEKVYFVERTDIDLDMLVPAWTTNSYKHLKQIFFHLQSPTPRDGTPNTFDITFGFTANLMDEVTWKPTGTVNLQTGLNNGRHKYDFRATGRYLAMRFDFSATDKIKMTGGDLDATLAHGR